MNKLNKRNYLSLTSKIVLIVFVTAIMLPVFTLVSQGADNNIALADEVYGDDVDNLAQKAVYNNYEAFCNGAPVNGEQGNLGSYDAYILSKANIDVSTWVYDGESLKEKVISLINNTGEEDSARSIAYKYLAAKSWDDVAKNDLLNKLQERQTETQAADGFDQGDYSIYNNMPAFEALGRAGAIDKIDTGSAINYILNKQDTETGTWAYSNFQVTAQAVRVLKYLKPHANNQDMKDNIQSAIDKAISWISNQQQEDGSFTVSTVWDGITYWDDKVIDTAEVIYTLNILEINPGTWENEAGYSPVDYMKTGALNDDGTFGMSKNITDNTFALDAYLMVGASVDDVLIVTPYNTTISEDEEQEFAAELYDFAGSEIDVSQFAEWTVDDESVASVVYKGQVKGLSAGDTVVTATYQDLTGNANISIKESGGNNDGNNDTGTSDGPEVSVEVIGQDEESLYSGEVSLEEDNLEWEATALGALEAAGLDFVFDDLVTEIEGQANEGMNGWMFNVNNDAPGVGAPEIHLSDGDQVTWWYSTDPNDIPGDSSSISYVSDDDMVLDNLEKTGEAKLDISSKGNNKAALSPDTISELSNESKPLIVENNNISLEFSVESLKMQELDNISEDDNASLEISARAVDLSENQNIENSIKESEKYLNIESKLFDLNTAVTCSNEDDEIVSTEKITQFNEPVKVTINLSDLNLSDTEADRLIAVRYEKDDEGNYELVQLDGSYNPEEETYTFTTDSFSYYGILKAKKPTVIKLQIDNLKPTVDGEVINLAAAPTIINSRTMVPLRFISECTGADVGWNSKTKTVNISIDDKQLSLVVGENMPGFDVPPSIINGRSFVPIRYVSESLGAEVTWLPDTKEVKIVKY